MAFNQRYSRGLLLVLLTTLVSAPVVSVDADSKPTRRVIVREPMGTGPAKIGVPPGVTVTPPPPAWRVGHEHDGPQPPDGTLRGSDLTPKAIGIGPDGTIYIADHINNKIARFDKNGRYLGEFPAPYKAAPEGIGQPIVTDMATDSAGNLYILSWFGNQKLYKHNQDGRLLKIIDLRGKDIHWDSGRKAWTAHVIQTNRILVAPDGSIYLRGFEELIKLSQSGDVLQKWALKLPGDFVLNQPSGVLLAYSEMMVEAYDSAGKIIWKRKCGVTLSRTAKGYCKLPEWVDRNGNLYWIEDPGNVVTKTDSNGKEMTRIDLGSRYIPFSGWAKFDSEGSMYFLNESKTEFLIEKVSFR